MLTRAAALLEVEEASCAAVTFRAADSGLTTTLATFVTVKRLGPKRVTMTRDAHASGADAMGLRLQRRGGMN